MKTKERQEARKLRRRGKSVNEIAQELGISKSSAYVWTCDLKVPKRLSKEARRARAQKRRADKAEQQAAREKQRKSRKFVGGGGYIWVLAPSNYKGTKYRDMYVPEHRFVLEKKLGRLLRKDEVPHHINDNKSDNRPGNLEVHTKAQHTAHHHNPVTWITYTCESCGKKFERAKSGKPSRFCSRYCIGKFGFNSKRRKSAP